MTNEQYLKKLKAALKGLERKRREEIVLEIRSHMQEMGGEQASLFDHFGAPSDLASRYLEDESVRPSQTTRVGKAVRIVLASIGALVIILVVGVVWLYHSYIKDRFDYSNEKSVELAKAIEKRVMIPWSGAIETKINQSAVIVYWHDQSDLALQCAGGDEQERFDSGTLKLNQDYCFLFLPKRETKIQAKQSSLTLIQPKAETDLSLDQSRLRIAENGGSYTYEITALQSSIEGLQSVDNSEHRIAIKAKQSKITDYRY